MALRTVFFILSVFATNSFAYVPPAEFQIQKLTEKRKDQKFVVIETWIDAVDADQVTGVRFKDTTQIDFESGQWTSVATFEEKVLIKKTRSMADLRVPVGALLLFGNKPETLASALISKDIPIRKETEKLRIQRFEGEFAWLIGDVAASASSLWIQKDSFLPLKLFRPIEGQDTTELRFKQYTFYKAFPYPRVIEISLQGKTALRASMERIDFPKTRVSFDQSQEGMAVTDSLKSILTPYYEWLR